MNRDLFNDDGEYNKRNDDYLFGNRTAHKTRHNPMELQKKVDRQ